MKHLLRLFLLICTMQSFGAIAQSNQLPAKFSTGDLRYDCTWGCNFLFDYQRHIFDELYRNEDWYGLVKKVDEIGLKSRTSYFYLFRAAEKLKFYDAAQIYLNLAKSDPLVMGCFAINKLDVCKELTDINYAVVRNSSSLENISKKENTQIAVSSTLLPTGNLPRCEGSVEASWNDCIGVIYKQGLPFAGQFRNGIPYGQFEKIANAETQLANTTNQSLPVQPNAALSNLPACEGRVPANWNYCYGSTEPFRGSNNKYSGEFINGKYSGLGTFYFSNGNKYVGEFKDAYFNGQGTLYASDGSIINQGIWANDKFVRSTPVQQATIPNQEIERLRSESAEAKRKQAEAELPPCPSSGYRHNCFGTFTSADGEIYVNEYQNGVRFGRGIQYNKNGSILRSGTWLNDQLLSSYPVDEGIFPFNPLAITLATNNQSLPVQPNVALSNLPAWGEINTQQSQPVVVQVMPSPITQDKSSLISLCKSLSNAEAKLECMENIIKQEDVGKVSIPSSTTQITQTQLIQEEYVPPQEYIVDAPLYYDNQPGVAFYPIYIDTPGSCFCVVPMRYYGGVWLGVTGELIYRGFFPYRRVEPHHRTVYLQRTLVVNGFSPHRGRFESVGGRVVVLPPVGTMHHQVVEQRRILRAPPEVSRGVNATGNVPVRREAGPAGQVPTPQTTHPRQGVQQSQHDAQPRQQPQHRNSPSSSPTQPNQTPNSGNSVVSPQQAQPSQQPAQKAAPCRESDAKQRKC